MALPTDLTGAGMGRIPGIAHMELMAVLSREYMREISNNTAGGLHTIAAQWNQQINNGRPMTPDDPFARDRTFTENYDIRYPNEAEQMRNKIIQRNDAQLRQEQTMQAMDNANLADAFRVPEYQNPDPLARDEEMNRIFDQMMNNNRVDIAPNPDQVAIRRVVTQDGQIRQEPLTYHDLHNVHEAMKAPGNISNDAWTPIHQATFQEHLIDWLSEREDLAVWLDSLGDSLNMDIEDTFEIALRMAMEVVYKENEAQMAGLNKKLQDMEDDN